jgi:hypothetical protein
MTIAHAGTDCRGPGLAPVARPCPICGSTDESRVSAEAEIDAARLGRLLAGLKPSGIGRVSIPMAVGNLTIVGYERSGMA